MFHIVIWLLKAEQFNWSKQHSEQFPAATNQHANNRENVGSGVF
jgi:hypothetical protein